MECDDPVVVTHEGTECEDPEAALASLEKQIQQINREIQTLQSRKSALQRRQNRLQELQHQQQSAALAKTDWSGGEYPWNSELRTLLSSRFDISRFRDRQLATINATLSGTHCVLIMPTGGGKSLCYQLPALLSVSKGVTLVVSPLLSLIEDQVMGLRRRGIDAAMMTSHSSKEEIKAIYTGLTDARWGCKLLYVTPERLAKCKRLMAKLQKAQQAGLLARIAIDEVHCCSQWGHDFRPDYKFLGVLPRTLPGVPLLGLTATATAKVVTDVQGILNIKGCLVIKASFNRPNLFYKVRPKSSSQAEVVAELASLLTGPYKGQSGIIYTTTIKETMDLVKELKDRNIRVAPYHGQLEPDVRSKVHQRWISGDYQAVVATIAFGMGIDKPDVRFVIHHSVSKSMENYYQESGRAGRDGGGADCVLFWRLGDLFKQSTMVHVEQTGLEKLYAMLAYCIDSNSCRRQLLAEHFGERWESSDCQAQCDHCARPTHSKLVQIEQHAAQVALIMEQAKGMEQKLTAQKLVDAWLGRGGPTNLRVREATNAALPRTLAETIVGHLLLDGGLTEEFHFTAYTTYSYLALGPKADAGIAPTPLTLPGRRMDNSDATRDGNSSANSVRSHQKKDCKKSTKIKTSTPSSRKDASSQLKSLNKSVSSQSKNDSEATNNGLHSSFNCEPQPPSDQPPKRRRIVTLDSDSDEQL